MRNEVATDAAHVQDAPAGMPEESSNTHSIVIASTFTADLVVPALNFWMETLEVSATVVLAPYAQVLQELLNPQSRLSRNKRGFDILLIRFEDWIRDRLAQSVEQNIEHVRRVAVEFADALQALRSRSGAAIFVYFCPESSSLPAAYREAFEQVRAETVQRLGAISHLYCWTHGDLVRLYPVEHEDARADRLAHIPYTRQYFAALATLLARRIAGLIKPACKVIAVDCDNTLWRGVCGEDGPHGVEVTPAHIEFQRMLVRQHDAGVLLCLCTKNNPVDVEAVFKARPDMPLREEHLVSSRVNWNSKSSNLKSLAQELDLGLDSFLFVDDSAMECAEVGASCPSVVVLQFPQAEREIVHFVDHVWAFDRVTITEDAKRRTEQYKKSGARKKVLEEADGLESFIASLELVVSVAPMQPAQLERVAELVQRTNQFNLTGVRRRASEIEALWKSGQLHILVVHVQDRFGDYGLVGAALIERQPSAFVVDTLVISCRALGRGVEHRIVKELGKLAREAGAADVVLRCRHTARNAPAREFLEESLAPYRAASATSDGVVEESFVVPAASAESLGFEHSRPKIVAETGESKTGVAQHAAVSHAWHTAAYEISKLPDLMRKMDQAAPKIHAPESDHVAPRTVLEAAVARIWAGVLGLQEISVCADFVELGGDSLLAVQAIAAIGSELGLELSVYDFFEGPTVAKVATKLTEASAANMPIEIADRTRPMPLSSSQQRLWFIDQLEGGSGAYHLPLALRLQGLLDRPALQEALDRIVSRHEALRTVFVKVEGEPAQLVQPEGRFPLQFLDLRGQVVGDHESAVLRQADMELTTPFDLSTGPLIRGRLLQLSEGEHVLVITMHHIVSDGWSIGVLVGELGVFYEALRGGDPHFMQPLPLQYADYAQSQRERLASGERNEQLAYWMERLSGAPELLELPLDRPRPATRTYGGSNVRVAIDADLVAGLKALARRENLTLAMTLYAGWSLLLSRISGQKDIVVGMPVANRPRTELEGLIGFFVNTLALRVQLEDDPPVFELLRRVRELMLRAYENQDIPFEKVVEALKPSRSLSYSPIFQVMFVLHNTPRSHFQLPGLVLSELEVPSLTAKFDLTLSLRESADGILGSVNYACDLFDGATVERYIECFKTLLRGMVEATHLAVSRVPLIGEKDRREVVELFNATRTPFPQHKLIHELFEERVAQHPNERAAMFEDQALTFAELNAKANKLARHLRDKGVGPDRRVALFLERGLDMIVGLLATWKAGGAYVPLDPTYPVERLQSMVQDSAPRVLLAHAALTARIPRTAAEIVLLDEHGSEIEQHPSENLDARALGLRPEHLAYVIYTSGSTGQPKGVMVEHSNVLSLWQGLERIYDQSVPCRRIAVNASINFDASVKQLIQLLSGRTLVLVPNEVRADANALLEFIDRQQIDGLDCTPSQLKLLIAAGLLESGHHLRMALVGGEAVDAELWSSLARCLQTDFYNVYGPTESTVDTTVAQLKFDKTAPHIGSPMENRQVYILDRHGEPLPVGVAGEMFIGGAGVARGYLNSPERTRERFIADPFSADPQARLYKTGDLARWRGDGMIEYLGRDDNQVKIRGFRIELEDVQAQLLQNACVKEAVVVARDDALGNKQLAAYVVLDAQYQTDSEAEGKIGTGPRLIPQLRAYLRSRVPDYMIPSAWTVLQQLPLTSNGKVDRKALPAPAQTRPEDVGEYVAPRTELEVKLADLWRGLLGVAQVGMQDNFFELGGHSLLVVKAMFEINKSFGCSLKVADVYGSPTVRELAARICGVVTQADHVDLMREAVLDDDIVPMPGVCASAAKAILLTGGTGFVGRFLLVQLLQDTDATLYCLVRAPSQPKAQERLRSTLEKWDLWREEYESRVVAIAGDLRLPRLGIEDRDHRLLAQTVDCIYHCGTSMNHLETYAMAKAANVDAAKELLRLATLHKPKLINYMSTLGVFSQDTTDQIRFIDEKTPIDHEVHSVSSGYVASKWVGERIFMTASERGIPCNIFRIGLVWADTLRGRYDELQREYRVFKSCLLSGYGIKNYRYEMPPMPVDHVARAIVYLGIRHAAGRNVFHIFSPARPMEYVFEACNERLGMSLELLSLDEWVEEMKRLHHMNQSLPIAPLLEFAFSTGESEFDEHDGRRRVANRRFDCGRTHGELQHAGVLESISNDELLRINMEGMLASDAELQELMEVRRNLLLSATRAGNALEGVVRSL